MQASLLKQRFMNNPDECFEALTFGELSVGQKFICLPLPGDNHGHGGFKGTHRIFTKTALVVDGKCGSAYGLRYVIPYNIPHGEAVNNQDQISDFPHQMLVVPVE